MNGLMVFINNLAKVRPTMFSWVLIIGIAVTYGQENAQKNLSPSLLECYENNYLAQRENRLPHTLNTLLAVLRKIEATENLNMNLRRLSVALLHRFRQDGVVENPKIASSAGVTPFAALSFQFYRHAQTLRLVQGNALSFPNNSISDVERCTLHAMFSSSIDIFRRGDEGTNCKYAKSEYVRRTARNIVADGDELTKGQRMMDETDVETLSPEEMAIISKNKKKNIESVTNDETFDPNSIYPDLPPNHPMNERLLQQLPRSECPVENGIIQTPWGDVAAGSVLAGIAAGLESQLVKLGDILQFEDNENKSILSENSYSSIVLDNKWLATLAGDLAEVALRQGPTGETLSVGAEGSWNSTTMPKWYLLRSNEKLEMTTAEIRGDIDGLILAQQINDLHTKVPDLRLSQVLDMYYSPGGLLNSEIRACNRRHLFTSAAPNDTMTAQAYVAALALTEHLARATIRPSVIEKFAVDAVQRLSLYIPTSMNDDPPCSNDNVAATYSPAASVDLTVLLDTNWPFSSIQPILATLLENLDVNPFDGNFTIINAFDGSSMIEMNDSIIAFYNYNSTHYGNLSRGFDLAKSLDRIRTIRLKNLNDERERGIAGGNSDVILIIPYQRSISQADKDYCLDQLKRIREESPDSVVLILTQGSKDAWSSLVVNAAEDLFSIGIGDTKEALMPLTKVISRIRQVPRRLMNTQCGADYTPRGSSNAFIDVVRFSTTNLYRLHPNYFYSSDSSIRSTIKIQSVPGWGSLKVCSSRHTFPLNTSTPIDGVSCATIADNPQSITVTCEDAEYIHQCPPLYISVTAINASHESAYRCRDARLCRFPDMVKYTISYDNLICTSGSNNVVAAVTVLLFAAITHFYL